MSSSHQDPQSDQDPTTESGRIEIELEAEEMEIEGVEGLPEVEELTVEFDNELEIARAEAAENHNKWLRSLAELENFRKRSRRELQTSLNLANADLLRQLLEVMDNFDRALDAVGDGDGEAEKPFAQGVRLIHGQLQELLRKNQVVPMEVEGQPFDPNLHEAVSQIDSEDAPPDHIVHVVQAGYRLNDTVLRPARVVVSR